MPPPVETARTFSSPELYELRTTPSALVRLCATLGQTITRLRSSPDLREDNQDTIEESTLSLLDTFSTAVAEKTGIRALSLAIWKRTGRSIGLLQSQP